MADMTFKAKLLPSTDLSSDYTLGSSSKRWKIFGDLTGNAATATKLATARTISLTGSVTGSGSFDGSGNLSIATTTNHNHYQLITEGDNRSVATTPNSYSNNLVFRGLKTNSTFGSPSSDTYSYVVGLRGWSDSSGGNAYELAFNNTGIYCRNGATTSWGSWNKILTLSDGNSAYVLKAGDTMTGTLTVPKINLNRTNGISYGRLQWYKDTYKTWTNYMSDAASGTCPSGGTPSTLGNVTTWAIRSYIENASGYGWLWESAAESNTGTPTARMALSSYDGTLEVAGLVKITKNSNTTTMGSQNANFCHIYNSANIPFIFNNSVLTTGGNLGDSTYPFDNLTLGRSNGAGIYYKGTKSTYRMIRFIDNTSDTYGNGISIGGGGQTIIGGGESADTAAAQAGTAGGEIMQVCNDGDVQIISNLQNGWNDRKTWTMGANGILTVPGPIINNFSSSSILRHFSDVAGSYLGNSATGIIKIKLPNTTSNMVMMTLRIMLYEYNTDSGKEIIVSGYTYQDGNWYNYRASAIGGIMSKAIRLAYDGTNFCVLIGATNSSWPYTTVQLADIYSSYGAQPETGYAISLITSESGLSNIKTVANQIWGAVWNDYAEYRKDNPNEIQEPGRCIKELGDGSLALTTQRLERGCEIVSDTFGFAIGKDEDNGYNTPIASNGRVLAYPYESIEEFASHIGWPVCSGPNGTVSIMTEEEEEKYPSRIIGTISEIPTYEKWGTGNVKVNGRVWIRIR